MKRLIIISLLMSFSFGVSSQEKPKSPYETFLDRLFNNHDMVIPPDTLIDEYNKLHNTVIDQASRNYIEECLSHYVKIDSLSCLYAKSESKPEVQKQIREYLNPKSFKKLSKLRPLYSNLLQNISSASSETKWSSHCSQDVPEVKTGGRVTKTTIIEASKTKELSEDNTVTEADDNATIQEEKKEGQIEEKREKAERFEKTDAVTRDTRNTDVDSTKETDTLGKKEEVSTMINLKVFKPEVTFSDLFLDDPRVYLTEDKTVSMEFCFVNKGSFNLGITTTQYREVLMDAGEKSFELNIQDEVAKPDKRYVQIDEPFLIAKYELSRGQFELILNGKTPGDDTAMTGYSEKELNRLLAKLNELYPNLEFDIHTEVEWEFAAKGSSQNYYISSNEFNDIKDQVVVNDTLGVRSIYPETCLLSPVNACNMIGNAKEICKANHQYYKSKFNTDTRFVARGGSFLEGRFNARTTSRHLRSDIQSKDIGLRLVVRKRE